jgi:hypothetical protein
MLHKLSGPSSITVSDDDVALGFDVSYQFLNRVYLSRGLAKYYK